MKKLIYSQEDVDLMVSIETQQYQEELEYEHYCNEQLRNKITNLEYKIKRLEEDNKQKEVLDKIKEEVEYWGYEEKYNDDKIFCNCMKKIHELLEEIE